MKGFKELSAVAISLLAASASAEDADAAAAPDAPSDVHVLGTDTFESFVKDHPLVLAECKLLNPFFFVENNQPSQSMLHGAVTAKHWPPSTRMLLPS
jgi:hypothetical protein